MLVLFICLVPSVYSAEVCLTEAGVECVFPLIYSGVKYEECTTVNNESIPWCSTLVDDKDNHIQDNWGNCSQNCSTTITTTSTTTTTTITTTSTFTTTTITTSTSTPTTATTTTTTPTTTTSTGTTTSTTTTTTSTISTTSKVTTTLNATKSGKSFVFEKIFQSNRYCML